MERNIKVVAVDEDGTFLLGDGVSFDRPRFERVFAAMERAGARLVVATGNHFRQVRDIFAGYEDRIGYVTANGAFVHDGLRELRALTVPREVAEKLVALAHEYPEYGMSSVTTERALVERGCPQSLFDEIDKYTHCAEWVDSLLDAVDDSALFSGICAQDELAHAVALFAEELGDAMLVVDSGCEYGNGYFDICLPGVTKADGLKVLLDEWGVAPEEAIAFGDAGNDIAMLELVGESWAMANGSDEVKAHADHIAPSNIESGVLEVLEGLFGV